MSQQHPVLIMAGGTGGHVYPALAVAEELRSRGIEVVWMGTRKGIEARLVPEQKFTIDWLGVTGLRGKGVLALVMAPVNLVMACYQAMRILHQRKPCAVLGMGGFVSGPGGLMSRLLGKPLVIHEQNAVPGLTNKLLAPLATKVLEAFPGSFKKPALHVGNPVRREIAMLASPQQRFKDRHGPLRLLVFGGSLGAVHLNQVVPAALAKLTGEQRPLVKHQAGNRNLETAQQAYSKNGVEAEVLAYIEDMASMYTWADLVICRSGAMTVSELAAAGLASILVPYPHAVDDHQTVNARYLADQDAAILVPQEKLTPEHLAGILETLDRQRLEQMATQARKLGMPQATRLVAEECLLAGGGRC